MTDPVPPFFPPTGQEVVLLLLGVVAVGSALLVVTTRQLVHAALWLVVSFGALAGCYLVLTAEFVAWVQVLIYVGAVIVLLLFGIMLTRAPIGRSADLDSGNKKLAFVVALATAGVLVTVVIDGFRTAYTPLTPGAGAAKELGTSVFRTWVLPFEALSVLLLAALIGAIVLSRTDIRGTNPTPVRQVPGPTPGPQAASPAPDLQASGPTSGHQASGPTSGHQALSPTSGGQAPAPSPGHQPPGNGQAVQQAPEQGGPPTSPPSEAAPPTGESGDK